MTFRRTVLIGTILWVVLITVLYHSLNRSKSRSGSVFRVGFLPVT